MKTSGSNIKKFFILASILIFLGAAAFLLKTYIPLNGGELLSYGNIDKLEILLSGERIELESKGKEWSLVALNGNPTNLRVRQKRVLHLLELIDQISKFKSDHYTEMELSETGKYQLNTPSLAINLEYPGPQKEKKELSLIFGTPLMRGNQVEATLFIPSLNKFISGSFPLFQYFSQRSLTDFLDYRISTFETDDVESFKSSGKCKNIEFFRNGDHWQIEKGNLNASLIDEFLDHFTEVNGSTEIASEKPASETEWCKIELKGLNKKSEQLILKKITNNLIRIDNSNLKSTLVVPATQLNIFAN